MNTVLRYLPFVSSAVSFLFAALVLRRFVARHGLHLLLWGIGLVFYGIGGLSEGLNAVGGWDPLVFRLWYLFGAMLVAAWLGQGTVYLWLPRTWAHALMIALALSSLYGAVRVFGAQLDPAALGAGSSGLVELSGRAIVSPGVRSLTPIFNSYGTLALVGGAIWSIIQFGRKRTMANRTLGNVFIAVGAFLPAMGGTFSRFGLSGLLYASELLGAVLMFIGFLLAVTPTRQAS